MSDYLFALLFLVVYEVLSWPLRVALSPIPMSPDLRRMISRLAGPPIVGVTAWFFAHFGVPLGFFTGWIFFGLFMAGAYWLCKWQGAPPDWKSILNPIPAGKRWKRELFIEVFGLFIFFSMLYFRRIVPEMTTTGLNGAGSEKFDNAMFFWSAWHARTLPPDDYWLSGNTLPYYYFGHFFWGWIGRMGLFPGEWVITLGISRLVMLIWESSFLLMRAFGLRAVSASIGAFFVAWGGNPHAIKTYLDQYDRTTGRAFEPLNQRKPRFDEKYKNKLRDIEERTKKPALNPAEYMYWDPAHAVIPGTIVEYPAWTAILGDFHAHHFSLPWNLAFVALAIAGDRWLKLRRALINMPLRPRRKKKKGDKEADDEDDLGGGFRAAAARVALALACLLVLGIVSVISNNWVTPLIVVASLGVFFWRLGWGTSDPVPQFAATTSGRQEAEKPESGANDKKPVNPAGAPLLPRLVDRLVEFSAKMTLPALLVVGILGGIYLEMGTLSNPVTATMSGGEAMAKNPNATTMDKVFANLPVKPLPRTIRSTMPQLMRHWGYQVAAIALGIAAFAVARRKQFKKDWMFAAALAGSALFCFFIKAFILTTEPFFFWLGMTALAAIPMLGKRPWVRPLVAVYICLTCFLLGGLEVFFVDDPMAGTLERYNSYFKLCFPAWGLMTAAAWVATHRLWHWRIFRPAQWALRGFLLLWIPPIMAMVYFGMPSRIASTSMSDIKPRKPTLSAFAWLANFKAPQDGYEYDAEEKMLSWIRENVPPGERVAEAVSWWTPTRMEREPRDLRTNINYSYVGRVASLAGRPVPLGWEGHEYTWRSGEAAKGVGVNWQKLRAIFYAQTPQAMRDAAKAMNTHWIVFGKSERDILNDPKSGTSAADVYLVLRQAGKLRFMYPEQEPKVFVFEIDWSAPPAGTPLR